jgi:tetratricopeptide (TPR) repeat protein
LWPGAFVAALFAWHPLHVESVAWIAERKDVLSTFFALLTLLAYVKAVTRDKGQVTGTASSPSPVTRHPSLFYWLAVVCFALALLAKPMMVTLPFVMLLLDYWPLKRFEVHGSGFRVQSLILEKIPFFALSAASCVITFLAQHRGGAVASLDLVPLDYRLQNTPLAYVGYLLKLICPTHLAILYPLPEKISPLAVAAAVAVLMLISAAVWFGRKRGPYWLVGWLWFAGMLVPVIGLVQVGGAAMADRYTYFPSIGIFLAVTLGMRDMAERFRFPAAIMATLAGLVLAACLVLTHRQLGYWRNDVSLFSHAIAATKDNDSAHLNLGFALEKIGRKADAMAEYRATLKLAPGRIEAHNNLANLLDDAGHRDEALAEYQAALRINPKYVPAHNNLGALLVEQGRFDEAMKHYAEAARLAPDDWHAPYLIGNVLLKQSRDEEAIPYFQRVVAIDPNNARVLAFLAQVLASDENPKIRNGPAAFAMADKANALTGGIQPAMLDVLAMAYAELGRFNDAQQAMQDALNLAGKFNMTNDLPILQQRLQLYQNHQPFRESFTNTPLKDPPKN